MFKSFYGLREHPFRLNPDPRFLYTSPEVLDAFAALIYGVHTRKGIVLLTGEVGTGKTTVLNTLLNHLHREKVTTACVFHAQANPEEFLEFVLADFEIPCPQVTRAQMLIRLHDWLVEQYRIGQSPVLIIDEAQNLSWEVLEEVRLLTNLETSSDKLLQVILAGQPELEQKLTQPRLRQLAQRIAIWTRTNPLSSAAVREYVRARLRIAGANGQPTFTDDALQAIHRHSGGIPRLVNLLCEHALINGYVDGLKPVPGQVVERTARDLPLAMALEGIRVGRDEHRAAELSTAPISHRR